jgi:hypothetical protein
MSKPITIESVLCVDSTLADQPMPGSLCSDWNYGNE